MSRMRFACRNRFFFVIVHLEVPFRALHCHHILSAGIGGDHEAFAIAFDMKRQQARRMSSSVDRRYARTRPVSGLNECRTVGERHADIHEKLTIELTRLSHVLAALPEIEFGGTEYIACVRKHRLSAFNQAANMVGMSMREDNDVNVLRPVSRGWRAAPQFVQAGVAC